MCYLLILLFSSILLEFDLFNFIFLCFYHFSLHFIHNIINHLVDIYQ